MARRRVRSSPFVTGAGDTAREHVASMIRIRPDLPTWQAITDGHWRATINVDTGEASELFDLDTDPDEATNLVGDAASGQALDRLGKAVKGIFQAPT